MQLKQVLDEAVLRHRGGDRQAARAALGRALELSPDHPDALHMLANMDGEDGQMAVAEQRVVRALQVRPEFPPYLATLSRIQAANGKVGEAIASLTRALQREPTASRFNTLGLLLLGNGQADESARAFAEALAREPANVAARVNLGVTRFTQGHSREAARHLQQALAQVPADGDVAQRLGLAWQACGEHEHAMSAFRTALKSGSNSMALRTSMGISCTALGRFDEAMSYFDEALTHDPACADALGGKAELLEWRGEYAKGLEILQPALQQNMEEAALLTVYARLLRRTGEAHKGLQLLQPLADSGRLSNAPLRQIRFTLGDLNDQLGQYDQAFDCYQRAHEYAPNAFSGATHRKFVDNLKLRFEAGNIGRLNHSGNTSTQPVFIVGMPRSGTSLTEQILAAHPQVYAAGERAHIGQSVQALAAQPNPAGDELAVHARAYLEELGEKARAASRVTDKMPLNFLYLGWVAQLFPEARVVWCRRDPRDTGLSCYTTNFIDPALAFCDRLEDIALYSKACDELMSHWQAVLDLPIFELQYEALVAQPETSVRALLEALDLDWEPACLAFHESSRVAKTSSHAQVREPFYTRAVGRWRNYATHLGPLIDALEHDA